LPALLRDDHCGEGTQLRLLLDATIEALQIPSLVVGPPIWILLGVSVHSGFALPSSDGVEGIPKAVTRVVLVF
jgi:hypothetical protein